MKGSDKVLLLFILGKHEVKCVGFRLKGLGFQVSSGCKVQ